MDSKELKDAIVAIPANLRGPIIRELDERGDELMLLRAALKDRESHIESLEARVPRWVPVGERLPEVRENVLVWGGDSVMDGHLRDLRHHKHPERIKDIWQVCSGVTCAVTHWMPLPEPPKEQGEKQ